MKKILLTIILISVFNLSFAAKWRVNNTSGIDADFTTLLEAHNAAVDGDTIYIEGSLSIYDNNSDVSISKKLVLIGPGYYLGNNPFTQANLKTANFNRIYFNEGSEGSILMGLKLNRVDINVTDITVRRNLVSHVNLNSNSFLVLQNFIDTEIKGNNCSGIVTNNIIRFATFNSNSTVSIYNNVIYYVWSGSYNSIHISNSEIRNNIIYDSTVSFGSNGLLNPINNNIVTNNIFLDNGTESNGNKFNNDLTSIFGESTSEEGKFLLSENSPAIGAGLNGVDCGPFGGDNPYVLSGIPPGPSIYEISAPATASKTEGLRVSIKIHSHL